jgi:hypothetical protein
MPPIQLPPTFLGFSNPVIADGMWAANVTWLVQKAVVVRYQGVLLVKWKERTFVLLDCPVELVHKVRDILNMLYATIHAFPCSRESYLVIS